MNQPLLTEELLAQLQGAPLQQLSRQLGTDPDQTGNAVAAALPLLLGALGRNSAQPQGAQALYGALQRDHGGGMDLGSVLGAVLGGGVRIGSRVLIGSGAVVQPGRSICDGAVIGSGAVVCHDIQQAGTYVGIPARRVS